MKKIIVILAKSAKAGHYCVAGIELATNRCIRPVTADKEIQGAVTAAELTYADKTEAQPLDLGQYAVLLALHGSQSSELSPAARSGKVRRSL